jgi:mono/diheme cytochrome c family protein
MERIKKEEAIRGRNAINAISVTLNGHVPYYYDDTEEERVRASEEIIENPYPITKDGLARGKELYNTFCGICHGEKGDGLGYLVRDPNPATGDPGGVYPAAPANFLVGDLATASNGRYYHAIMYGKNVMGGYADKMSFEERWQVIHYIRTLQAADVKATYDEMENSLNKVYGTPMAVIELGEE